MFLRVHIPCLSPVRLLFFHATDTGNKCRLVAAFIGIMYSLQTILLRVSEREIPQSNHLVLCPVGVVRFLFSGNLMPSLFVSWKFGYNG